MLIEPHVHIRKSIFKAFYCFSSQLLQEGIVFTYFILLLVFSLKKMKLHLKMIYYLSIATQFSDKYVCQKVKGGDFTLTVCIKN